MFRTVSLTAGVFAIGLFAGSAVAAGDTITIGIPVGLSGANSVVAPSAVQASELAVDVINAKGGILGKRQRDLPLFRPRLSRVAIHQ